MPQLDRWSIIHINTQDKRGGAAKVAERLALGQRSAGHGASLLVGFMENTDSGLSIPFATQPDWLERERLRSEGWLDYEYRGSDRLPDHPLVREADVLHLHNLHGGYFHPRSLIKLSQAKPTVWTLHDMQALTGHCAHSFMCDRWQTGCGSCPDLAVYPRIERDRTADMWADKQAIYAQSRLQLVSPSRWLKNKVDDSILSRFPVEVIPNGVDIDVYRPMDRAEARSRLGLPAETFLIGCSADYGVFQNVWKGGQYIRRVLDWLEMQEINYIFVNIGGSGDPGHPKIRNTGHIADESQMALWLSAMDLYLYTSIADNCPLVIIEALSCGLPVITFATGGIPELVRHGVDGYVADYRDVQSLIHGLDEAMYQPDLRARYASHARQHAVGTFDHRLIAARYEAIYRRAIVERRSGGGVSISTAPKTAAAAAFPPAGRLGSNPECASATGRSAASPRVLVLVQPPGEAYFGDGIGQANSPDLSEAQASPAYCSFSEQTYPHVDVRCGTVAWFCESGEVDDYDLVYIAEEGWKADRRFLEWTCSAYDGEDICYTLIQGLKKSGGKFYQPLYPDMDAENGELRLSAAVPAGLLIRADVLKRNSAAIQAGQAFGIERITGVHAPLILADIGYHLRRKLAARRMGRLMVYGAGSHTKELLEQLCFREDELLGIVDRNEALSGQTLAGYPIYGLEALRRLGPDGVLLSSLSYENDIYRTLRSDFTPGQLIRIYGHVGP